MASILAWWVSALGLYFLPSQDATCMPDKSLHVPRTLERVVDMSVATLRTFLDPLNPSPMGIGWFLYRALNSGEI